MDILVNNAGILRDKTLYNMEESEWDGIMEVHLKGHYNCTRPLLDIYEMTTGLTVEF